MRVSSLEFQISGLSGVGVVFGFKGFELWCQSSGQNWNFGFLGSLGLGFRVWGCRVYGLGFRVSPQSICRSATAPAQGKLQAKPQSQEPYTLGNA